MNTPGTLKVRQKSIVLLGMMSKMPVAGNMWLVAQYIVGFRRLGYRVYYVEAHGIRPASRFLVEGDPHGTVAVCEFIDSFMQQFDAKDSWAYHAINDDGRCRGLTDLQLQQIYCSADLIINLHGATTPLPEHTATNRLVYLETDPVQAELSIYNGNRQTIDFLMAHDLFFTWGLNYRNPDCRVPVPPNIPFQATLPPVVMDYWDSAVTIPRDVFTTVGNWRQRYARIPFEGEIYHWSKHHEFLKFIDLPRRVDQRFELALSSSSYDAADKKLLEDHDWQICDALEVSATLDSYRSYIVSSRGEFTVAKDQNVRLRSGWFSERSAQYLASGRPVITQDTGFGAVLPTGLGLHEFCCMEGAVTAVDQVNSDYDRHSSAATEIAKEFFSYDVVLGRLLEQAGL